MEDFKGYNFKINTIIVIFDIIKNAIDDSMQIKKLVKITNTQL